MRNIYCIFFLISVFTSLEAQKQIEFSELELKKSLLKIKESTDLNRAAIEYDFISEHYYNNIFSTSIINDIKQVISQIELPFNVDSLKRIRMIESYYATHSYSYWYITLEDLNRNYYYYQYQSNVPPSGMPLVGITAKEDYIWKAAQLLYNNREGKSDDFLVVLEIENSKFTEIKATQTFHIADDAFFKVIMRLIKDSCK